MDSSVGSVKIEELIGSNYYAWDQKIVLLLSLRDLYQYIEDGPPVTVTDDAELKNLQRGIVKPDLLVFHACKMIISNRSDMKNRPSIYGKQLSMYLIEKLY